MKMENLYKIKNDIKNKMEDLNNQLEIIDYNLTKSFDISMEIGVDVTPDDSVNHLKINDEILFIINNQENTVFRRFYGVLLHKIDGDELGK